ncbi:MAG TPA: EscU/YscU/HrcU family type III secretion system export apparatus switch protein [Verrucomicrobiae bacterium]
MSEEAGEKTEQATPKKLQEALQRGQFPRSAEVQTVFVLLAGLTALQVVGPDIWNRLTSLMVSTLGHLHDIPVTKEKIPEIAIEMAMVLAACVLPIALACMISGTLAGALQSRFNTANEALEPKWERLNPVEGFQRIFSPKAAVPALLSICKLMLIAALCYNQVRNVFADPIFHTSVDMAGIAGFLGRAGLKIAFQIAAALVVVAAIDYGYQFWRTQKDMMMTKEEVKDEYKNAEGDQHMKARMKRGRKSKSQRQMLAEVPTADVIVTNPTRIAIALRYDKKTMKAPTIVAKGIRLNAKRIRELAQQHNIPIIENKPVARLMFKYGKVGGEIPAQLYSAVAEILAWVYRVNRYRYYAEQNQS